MVATATTCAPTRSGREFYAIGSSPEAARLAGVPVRRRILAAYLVCGALAGLAGVLWLARFGTVVADAAHGWELHVVSAVVVGGVAITGGVGSVYGAALGALLLTTIGSALVVLRVNSVLAAGHHRRAAAAGDQPSTGCSPCESPGPQLLQEQEPPWLPSVSCAGTLLVGALLIAVFAGRLARLARLRDVDNLSFALGDLGEIALIALAMTMLVVAGEVDLSVASVLGLSSALVGSLWDARHGDRDDHPDRRTDRGASAGWSTACW